MEKVKIDNPAEDASAAVSDEEQIAGTVTMLEEEAQMSFSQSLRKYPKAVIWSICLSTAVIMEGYDIGLLNSFYGFPPFQNKYGTVVGNTGKHNVSAAWQSGLTQSMHVGQIFGLMINGWAMERFGLKRTQCAALLVMGGFIFIQFFAPSIAVLCVGELLIGFPLGIFLTLSTVYAADVCPTSLRAYLTTYINICWVIGKLIATGVLRGFIHNGSMWAYRIPFAIQWVWIPFILVASVFAPESPYWLVRQNRLDEARDSLKRLSLNASAEELDMMITTIIRTEEHEKAKRLGTSYRDCFRGINLRRTEIACATYSIQPLCGFALTGSATYFLEQAGMSSSNAFNITLASLGISFCGGILVWFLLLQLGRRTLYSWGLAGIVAIQLAIGFAAIPHLSGSTAWATGVMLILFSAVYSVTVGPVTYAIVSEAPSTGLKAKTVALARNVYNIMSIVSNILTNYQINATAWDWKGKAGFFWAGSCALCWLWVFFRLPEMKSRTYAELNVLFEAGVPARKFKRAQVDMSTLSLRL